MSVSADRNEISTPIQIAKIRGGLDGDPCRGGSPSAVACGGKLRIVAEAEQSGASFAAVARRNEISHDLLWNSRQQVRRSALAPAEMPVFVPVRITRDPAMSVPVMPPSPVPALLFRENSRVEITLPDGTSVRVGAEMGLVSLRRIMATVRR